MKAVSVMEHAPIKNRRWSSRKWMYQQSWRKRVWARLHEWACPDITKTAVRHASNLATHLLAALAIHQHPILLLSNRSWHVPAPEAGGHVHPGRHGLELTHKEVRGKSPLNLIYKSITDGQEGLPLLPGRATHVLSIPPGQSPHRIRNQTAQITPPQARETQEPAMMSLQTTKWGGRRASPNAPLNPQGR